MSSKKDKKKSSSSSKHKRTSSNSSQASDIEASDQSDNETLQKKFKMDINNEQALVTMKCSHKSRKGKLRMTEQHLFFLANVQLGLTKKKTIAFSQLLDMEFDRNGVKFTLREGKSQTFVFADNEVAANLIEGQWRQSGYSRGAVRVDLLTNSLEDNVAPGGSRSRSNSTSSVGSNRSSGNFDKESRQLNQSLTLEGRISDTYGNDTERVTQSLRRHFDNVPREETVVREYQCGLKGALMTSHGKLYITQRYLYFFGGFGATQQKFHFRLLEIMDICIPEKSKKSILLSNRTDTYIFTGFKDKRQNVIKALNDYMYDAKMVAENMVITLESSQSKSTGQSKALNNVEFINKSQETIQELINSTLNPLAASNSSASSQTSTSSTQQQPQQQHPLSASQSSSLSNSQTNPAQTSSSSLSNSQTTNSPVTSTAAATQSSTSTTQTTTAPPSEPAAETGTKPAKASNWIRYKSKSPKDGATPTTKTQQQWTPGTTSPKSGSVSGSEVSSPRASTSTAPQQPTSTYNSPPVTTPAIMSAKANEVKMQSLDVAPNPSTPLFIKQQRKRRCFCF
ncbi:hypothetical protein SAMD00019534_020190 [Acytostelium subglobosum LB1]|uniref:hypothetical protein n=1 Tax=Acytostelium subglobosum LB1 TaxID=1410327 RepID=UPI0006448D07|nr:hypothetical protein SAMD00019534_020190 [Acytostelium subglobosum LB1]GAM18844.1 hypothetical protein SAMD00019534_020190 [Acytostelium subglobosum LB1]|eukprot:XP_012758064.1 hypothetical protein SAMD00019534_020190 [Acytostelium subglobosum LB1]